MSDDDVTMFVDGQVSDKEGNYNNYYNPVCVCVWVGGCRSGHGGYSVPSTLCDNMSDMKVCVSPLL